MSEKIFHFHNETSNAAGGINWRASVLDSSFLLHTHDYYEIEYASSGSGINTVNGIDYPIEPGSFWILGPHDDHMLRGNHAAIHHIGIYLPDASRDLSALLEGASLPIVGKIEGEAKQERILSYFALFDDAPESGALRGRHYQAVATLLCTGFLSSGNRATDTIGKTANYVRLAIRYVNDHIREPLSLSDVATELHIVPCYLSSIFARYAGCPFHEYVTKSRLRHARILLVSTEMSITDVAGESGFGCVSAMNRAFRKHLDTTPSALRKYGSA